MSSGNAPKPGAPSDVTGLLEAFRHGNAAAGDELLNVVYGVLHEIAARQLQRERPDHTLQPTILLHDAWLRLTDDRAAPWTDRNHFFALATRAMRRLLVDHARARAAGRRRGDLAADLNDDVAANNTAPDPVDLIALDEALDQLAAVDDRARRVTEMRFFGGLEWNEIAGVLDISEATAKRDWRFARVWLRRQMDGTSAATNDPSSAQLPPTIQ